MKATCTVRAGMGKEIRLMEQLEKDNEWFKSEFDELQEKYQKKFVAIKNDILPCLKAGVSCLSFDKTDN